ncbi:hypothetical protein BS297_09440 [Rhodococcus erythropolis]|uniref:Uncharacterized protein n=1 Tax=Rhodococcus erythropolis TaxID=1833 RepID=A0A5N5EDA0_RHOER|nr:hypothetical protein BS297_09440 [Rhodococcus erythropolis]
MTYVYFFRIWRASTSIGRCDRRWSPYSCVLVVDVGELSDVWCSSKRVHSRYERMMADAAIAGRPSYVAAQVRRFLCSNTGCARTPAVTDAHLSSRSTD